MRPHPCCSAAVSLLMASAGVSAARAESTVDVQVSRGLAEDWHSTMTAHPGDLIDVRIAVSYTGTASPLGLSSFVFQPTISNWRANGDTLQPLVNNGLGSDTTTPRGSVPDAPGQYGRITAFGFVANTATTQLRGFTQTQGGVSYLRIAQSYVTNWIGGAGNTGGGGGVNIHQLADVGRTLQTPPFNPALTQVVLFKFGLVMDAAATAARNLAVDLPLAGIFNGTSPYVGWYLSPIEPIGSLRETPIVHPGLISIVPAPGPLGACLLMLTPRRRRR